MPVQAKGQVCPEKSAYHSIALLIKSSEKDISLLIPGPVQPWIRLWSAALTQSILIRYNALTKKVHVVHFVHAFFNS